MLELGILCQSLEEGSQNQYPKESTRDLLLGALFSSSCHESFLASKGLTHWSQLHQSLSWLPLCLASLRYGCRKIDDVESRSAPHVVSHLVKSLCTLASSTRKKEHRGLTTGLIHASLVDALGLLREKHFMALHPLHSFAYLTALQVISYD